MKKIVVYGMGQRYKLYEERIRKEYDVVFIADNDPKNGEDIMKSRLDQ